ncbi:MAG TPA: ABC transporter ATP-binding protein [Symbiobacteriaceae bacterium]|jgi:ABC-type lipoprotein export system ATPase subunit|nr:ABC transporter ATP-binding protein [Symbiobacteriaceae bacterium]
MAIRLNDVTKRFRMHAADVTILDGVNLTVDKGEALALVGSSGAGKSTLLSLIAGLDRPSSGRVVTAGIDLAKAKTSELAAVRFRHIGFIFQQYHLIPTLTALENVILPCVPWKVAYEPRRRAEELLQHVGLGHRTNHLPAQLSGGEQQRVCIARALINRPSLLLADEPTGNLDDESAGDVLGLIRGLAAQYQMSLLLVTHDMSLAKSFGRVLRLQQGHLGDL